MNDFNRDNRSGRSGGGRRRFGGGGRDFGRREMHRATCAQCGKDCEIPFRPSGDRPVYCSDCFENRRSEDGNSRGSGDRNFTRPKFEEKRAYPPDRGDKENARTNDNGQIVEQLRILNSKLDKIISLLEPKAIETPDIKEEVIDFVLKPKVIKSEAPKKRAKKQKVEIELIPQS